MSENVISPKKQKAIAALLSEKDIRSAASLLAINERTLYRWLAEPHFQMALLRAEGELIDIATRRLIQLQQPAIDAINAILLAPDTTDSTKLRAAQTTLDYLIKLRELRNLENRLVSLEEIVDEITTNKKNVRKGRS